MADDEGGSKDKGIHKIIPAKGDSPHRRREKIIVLGTIALVILTVILVAHRASGGGSGQTSDPGETGIAGPDDSADINDGTTGSTGGSGGSDGGGGTIIIRGGNRQVAALRKRLARQQALAKSRRSIIAGQHRTIAFQRQTINRLDHPINHKGRHGQQHSAHRVIKPVIGNDRAPSRPIGTPPRHANP